MPVVSQLARMYEGVEVDGTLVVPVEVEGQGELERVRVVVAEGKKHEVGWGGWGQVGGGPSGIGKTWLG